MQTSAKGTAALELEEGVVLRAYRDVVGVWTIGAGLTAASGVVRPQAGMVITKAEATALLQEALTAKYEPAVRREMPDARQSEFDAGVSFHFNTGAIARASWVPEWRKKSPPAAIRARMALWNKGGGRVLPGRVARREREATMLLGGIYRGAALPAPISGSYARWGLALSGAEITAVRDGLRKLGYDPGGEADAVLLTVAKAFQRDNGLTVDGIIGRATLSALQRALDARTKAVAPALATAAAVPAATTGIADQITDLPWAGDASLLGLGLWGVTLAFRYRDVIAASINHPLPRLAALLRSF